MNRVKVGKSRSKNLRVFPSLVVDQILIGALAVVGVRMLYIENLGFIQDLMVETKNFFVFLVSHLGNWSHLETV